MQTADSLIADSIGLWWNNTPQLNGHRIGCLGGFETITPELLEECESQLRKVGCTLAIGPMMGNTWRKHRAVIASDGRPPFLLEPFTSNEVAPCFQGSGYQTLMTYSSSLIDLSNREEDPPRLLARLDRARVTIRPLRINELEPELRHIFHLSLKAFTDNFLYTPINEEEFLAMYLQIAPLLTPNCAFLAECEGELVGFVFGFPQDSTMIVKTLAVLPERRFAGLGTVLVNRIQTAARDAGCSKAIHALQREDNQSLRISQRFSAQIFRRYALFSKAL
ncbi:GNAT family N-acetyltransferase [Verrucomicrobiaceae bacterium 227]